MKNKHNFSFIIAIFLSNLYVNKYKLKIELETNSLPYRWPTFTLIHKLIRVTYLCFAKFLM